MNWRFALRPKWLAGHLVVAAMVVLMLSLSAWQFDRLEGRKLVNDRLRDAQSQPAAVIGATPPDDLTEFRRVSLSGTWMEEATVYVRYPILDGRQGYYVVTPLRTSPATAVLVNRGWIPVEEGSDDARAAAGGEPATISGLLRDPQRGAGAKGSTRGTPAVPTVEAIDPSQLQSAVAGAEVAGRWVQLESPVDGRFKPLPPPEITEGSHFAYALQWIGFGLTALVGWIVLLYRTARETASAA